MLFRIMIGLFALACTIAACTTDSLSCYGPGNPSQHVRRVKRMQPAAQNATSDPRGPLAWGQLNFIHTTDTHGWLEGHIKEENYGADWGDFRSFVAKMRLKASALNVDLLVIDTGDLHDGNGLSDAESPDGASTNPIFEQVDFDLLTIGNHELYISDIAFQTANSLAKYYGDRYISSNVQIYNNITGQYEYFAKQYRYFHTNHGLRVMAFGVLYDFTGNSNASKVIKAATMINQQWFKQAVNYHEPIDIFLLIGHNPLRSGSGSTLTTIQNAIRSMRPDVPIQVFGGHTHIRDFAVFDTGSTGLESGRYCETMGFLSMSGIKSRFYHGSQNPVGVPNPSMRAVKVQSRTSTLSAQPAPSSTLPGSALYSSSVAASPSAPLTSAFADLRFFRRYLDWNRRTFAYHAVGSQSKSFDTNKGVAITKNITGLRKTLNLTALYGCAPATYCISCKPFGADGSIFKLLSEALATTVVNQSRAAKSRLILINTGSVRFDLVEGPFTYDDSFIVSPFHDTFEYIPDVPYQNAKQVLGILNAGAYQKRQAHLTSHDQAYVPSFDLPLNGGDDCVNASAVAHSEFLSRRESRHKFRSQRTRDYVRRLSDSLVPGYVTTDDFGQDGDDTIHSPIPYYSQPNDLQANASFPRDGTDPVQVDLIFLDFIGKNYVLPALKKTGLNYTINDIQQYLPPEFDTNAYLPAFAKIAWQANMPNCPVGQGIGFSSVA